MRACGSFPEDERRGTTLLVDRAATFGTFHQQTEVERDDSIQSNVSSYENSSTKRLGIIRRRAEGRIGQTGVCFAQPPRRSQPHLRGCWQGAGSGERHDETKTKNELLERPHTSRSTARPPGGVHRHTRTPRQRGGRHATGPVSAHRRDGMLRAAIYERDWRPSCIVRRSSLSSVASGAPRTAMRVTTTAASSL